MSDTPERSLEQLVGDLERLEAITDHWDPHQKHTAQAIRHTVEAIQCEAFRRLIRVVKQEPGGLDGLRNAVDDPWVQGVLHYHGLLRAPAPSIEDQVEQALVSIRPLLVQHDGNVELVAVEGSEVRVRLLGTCDGCAFSDATLHQGIEKAVKDAVPSIERVIAVAHPQPKLVQLRTSPTASPFAGLWTDAAAYADVPVGGVLAAELERASVLLTATTRGDVIAYPNACTHLGMPLDGGTIEQGVLTCPYHGFTYRLATGECLTAPDIALQRYAVRIEHDRVLVNLG